MSSSVINRGFPVFKIISHIILLGFSLICILPLILVVSVSLSSEESIMKQGYSLIPEKIDFTAYKFIFADPGQLLTSYGVTIFVCIVGTIFSIIITTMLAYVMSRKDYPYAQKTSLYVFLTMLVSGGLVPWYIIISRVLHMSDTIWVLIAPYLVMPMFVLIMKGFMSDIAPAIIESGKLDGASEYRVFFSIVVPITLPGIVTVSLFILLMYWNDYYLSLMFIQNSEYVSLQFLLWRIMSNADYLRNSVAASMGLLQGVAMPDQSARMAICVLAAGPMMFIFPFANKYFVKGITVGSVKG
ncbi:carbohydrate ABC transporter permease [Paenibacillus sp. GCM10027629]|uniref:carbohydrate ABC transporter permease n=1 Tax=Paenibacillus sp. GCM10027629 TaxID=3273414 RepID=UPI003643C3FB